MDGFFDSVVKIIESARHHVSKTIDITMCIAYYEIGRMIVEEEQSGEHRAKYGAGLLKELSAYLTDRFGKGFTVQSLMNFRMLYVVYSPQVAEYNINHFPLSKSKTVFSNSIDETKNISNIDNQNELEKSKTVFSKFTKSENINLLHENTVILQKVSVESNPINKKDSDIVYPFSLSWSHYLILMRIKNDQERSFYEIEAHNEGWSVRQLQRQYHSSLYERLLLSRDKDEVKRLAKEGQKIETPDDIIKNPLVLEFLNLDEHPTYTEKDIEGAIISKLQEFMLELGKGFLFEARQKRFTFDEQHYFVDLVFYNRLLQCYVLIDLKTTSLKHQDLGQMQMYVNYYDRFVKTDFEKPTIGILICREKNDNVVNLTLPQDANIYAAEYNLYLPNKELLQQKLSEWENELEEIKIILQNKNG